MVKAVYRALSTVAPLVLVAASAVGLTATMVSRPVSSREGSVTADVTNAVARVDEACHEEWQRADVAPRPPADALTVARRLSLALVGTVPSLEEVRRIEATPAPDREDAYLSRLLDDRRFSDYWAERLARAFVGTEDGPFLTYRRRRFVYWLSDALDARRPYDEVVVELVAQEGLWTDHPATNFVTSVERDPVKLAGKTSRAFLGVRLDCAQCHDHPFSHWKQADFEGLAAFFAGVEQKVTGIHDTGAAYLVEPPGGEPHEVAPRVPFAPQALPTEGRARERLARWIVSPDNPNFARATAHRVWTLMFGRGLTHAVDDIEPEPLLPGVLEALADDFVAGGYDLRRLVRVVASTRAFRAQSSGAPPSEPDPPSAREVAKYAAFPTTQLRAEQIAGALVQMSSLSTIDAESHVLSRLRRFANTNQFIERYGDAGADELSEQPGTMMQRLTLMNGNVVQERTKAGLFTAAGRIGKLAPDDATAVDVAFLTTLTRHPDDAERAHFVERLRTTKGKEREAAMEDLMWALCNTTEFSWTR
jgi:hypothetical protein